MKKLLLAMSVLFIISCSKKDTTDTNSMSSDSLASDSAAAIPNPAPQTDSTSKPVSGSMSDSNATSSNSRKDSAK